MAAQITGVEKAHDADAVNVSQLKEVQAQVAVVAAAGNDGFSGCDDNGAGKKVSFTAASI